MWEGPRWVLFWQSLAECAAGVLFPVSRGSKTKKTDDDDDDDDSTTTALSPGPPPGPVHLSGQKNFSGKIFAPPGVKGENFC